MAKFRSGVKKKLTFTFEKVSRQENNSKRLCLIILCFSNLDAVIKLGGSQRDALSQMVDQHTAGRHIKCKLISVIYAVKGGRTFLQENHKTEPAADLQHKLCLHSTVQVAEPEPYSSN